MRSFFVKSLLVITTMIGTISGGGSGIQAGEPAHFGLDSLFVKPKKCSPWVYGGHLESGLYVNEYGQKNTYNGASASGGNLDVLSGNTFLLQNVHQSDLQLHQLGVFFGKELNTRCGWDIGGRIDYIYGTDARLLQSKGLEKDAGHGHWGTGDYYSAMAQMYFEAGYKNLSVKFGKFLSPIGHESIISDQRFFYSLSRSYGVTPATHTGALVTWDANKKLSVFGGWVQGENEFFESSDNNAFLGGFEYQINPHTKWGYSSMTGEDKYAPYSSGQSNSKDEYFVHSLYLLHNINKRWDYTFEWTLRNLVEKDTGSRDASGAYGIDQALYYKLNCKWSLGFRFEWEHEIASNGDIYGFTFGANWKPCPWLLIRPEMRYDSVHGGNGFAPFNLSKSGYMDGKTEQLAGGFSTVIRF